MHTQETRRLEEEFSPQTWMMEKQRGGAYGPVTDSPGPLRCPSPSKSIEVFPPWLLEP